MTDQIGDATSVRKYNHDFEKEPYHDPREPKFSYPSLMEAQIRKLKHSFQHWKEIIVPAKRVLFWEKQWHPTALIGASSIVFTFLWLLDPSVLTVISMLGLCLTLSDSLLLSFGNSVFIPEKWTPRQEQEFEECCTNVILYKARFELTWGRYCRLKTTNKKLYLGVTISTLSVLAWIGCTVNNLFLTYVFITIVLLLPGMEHNGILKKISENVQSCMMECLRQSKTKVPEKKD